MAGGDGHFAAPPQVAPHAGARIETWRHLDGSDCFLVAPHAGARIELGWVAGIREPDEQLASEVVAKLRPGPKEPVASSEKVLAPFKEQIEQWLEPPGGYKSGLKPTKIHGLLKRRTADVSYWSLRRFAQKLPPPVKLRSTFGYLERSTKVA